jgi:alkylation response protein AidB-like acyl-CoA dehydrogenase
MTFAMGVPEGFGFTEEHLLLKQGARRYLEAHAGPAVARRLMARDGAWDPSLHRAMAELGWIGLALSEARGGPGLGALGLVLVLEEAGRALLPGPLFPCVLAVTALDRCADDAQANRWLPGIVSGERVATLAFAEPGGAWDPVATQTRAEPEGGGFALSGTRTHVMSAAQAALALVPAVGPEGEASLFVLELPAAGAVVEPEDCIDPTRPTARLELQGAVVPAGARLVGAADALREVARRARVWLAAEMVGGAEAVLAMSCDYARERVQFGRAIGSFQAVKHPLVDMMVGIEQARSLVYGAAAALDAGAADAEPLSRMAKAQASDVYAAAVRKGVQVHGGLGFTWEHDMHLWFRRALWSRPMLGDGAYHRRQLAAGWVSDDEPS